MICKNLGGYTPPNFTQWGGGNGLPPPEIAYASKHSWEIFSMEPFADLIT